MRARSWAIVIAVNVAISAVVVLVALSVWGRSRSSTPPASTPHFPTSEEAVSAPTPPFIASPTPQSPLLHVVQGGDTLGAIAQTYGVSIEDLMAANGLTDPNVLHVGQTLVIPIGGLPVEPSPEPSPTSPPLSTVLPTLTPSGPPLIEIGQVLGSGDLAAEVVIVRNRGGLTSLEGWTLSDADGNMFVFPAITLFSDAQVRVYSAAGSTTPTDLYWGRLAPAWSGGELITLRDLESNVVDTYIVP